MADVFKRFIANLTTTDFVSLRGRGREFTVNVVSNTTGTAWRLGTQRFDIQPDGRR